MTSGVSLSQQDDFQLARIIKTLPDLSYEVTAKNMPSVIIASPSDPRIDKLARTKTAPFTVKSETSESFLVVVNPKASTGYLWWKSFKRLVIQRERLQALQNETITFTPEEKSFILSIK
jgi:hypothetical protein